MKKNITLLLLSLSFLLVSCSVGPFYMKTAKGTEVVSAGGSIMTKSDSEDTFVQKGDFTASHSTKKKNEVSVPNNAILAGATVAAAEAAADAAKVISNNKVAETTINSATSVELAQKANEAAAAKLAAEAATNPVPIVTQ
jgi:hypothetical protein